MSDVTAGTRGGIAGASDVTAIPGDVAAGASAPQAVAAELPPVHRDISLVAGYAYGVNLDANALLASLFIGLVGTACFVYGRRQGRLPPMAVGAAMVIYPYFVPNVLVMVAVAVALLVALWGAMRAGW